MNSLYRGLCRRCSGGGWYSGVAAATYLALALVLSFAGCSIFSSTAAQPAGSPSASESAAQAEPTPSAAPSPSASIAISYSKPGDYLVSFSVVKYAGTRLLNTHEAKPGQTSSIVIFEGGVPIWEFAADRGLLGHLGFKEDFNIAKVAYGQLPHGFLQSVPSSGPPEPLEPGRFYIFSAERNSGSISYEAIKVEDDGSFEGYNADPLAGSSFDLCCNLNPDFIVPSEPPQQ
ncbi:MAG: hypothetical protein IVW54_03105 [Candidatus Binataceae bacterium]|nr:hypothetical protein [Candidatus Binataceae bacterium]